MRATENAPSAASHPPDRLAEATAMGAVTLHVRSGKIAMNGQGEYDWHPWAKIWQTPGEGERWMRDLDPVWFVDQLVSFNMPADYARRSLTYLDDNMRDCILKLYRSAINVGSEWEAGLADVTAPSLILWGLLDGFLPNKLADRMGEATHADAVVKLRCGHWLPLERPDNMARELNAFWSRT